MKIDRTNYEIWFIDWLDGSLSKSQVEQLLSFLKENPDLKEELNELENNAMKGTGIINDPYPFKELLKKSPADIPSSQFEFMCVAYLENDLTVIQKAELKEIIDNDPEKNRTFKIIQKTRLVPVNTPYRHKRELLKRTLTQKIIRLSVVGLSAAAIIAFIIISRVNISRNPSVIQVMTAENIIADSSRQKVSSDNPSDTLPASRKSMPSTHKIEYRYAGSKVPAIDKDEIVNGLSKDSLVRHAGSELIPSRLPVNIVISFEKPVLSYNIIPSSLKFNISGTEEERSNIGRFIAKTFREKILKEKTMSDSPLKGYEIAEAGVTGLNKLLGWEMALKENTDANGELKSVNFSSRLLKFNLPVNKSKALP